MKRNLAIIMLIGTLLLACSKVQGQPRKPLFNSLEGLAMTGYQGWFNAEGDGMDLGWKHYEKKGEFRPGMCSIDMWPDVSEYEKTYPTAFNMADGSKARVFSSADRSTTFLHFKWMEEYGIDGAFMQRFVTSVKPEKRRVNYNQILFNALSAAEKHGRAISVMYDLSGCRSEDMEVLINDWKSISQKLLKSRNYLHHNGRPLVAVWGVGFNDNRKYNLDDCRKVIEFLKSEGCSVLLGVPAYWRTLNMDTLEDTTLHELIAMADVVHPWFVGRFNNESYDRFTRIIKEDKEWCDEHDLSYIPVVFPGFSWFNLKNGVAAPSDQIPRLEGRFLWKQIHGAVQAGAKSLYFAMFDEVDEGTAIFKCAKEVPVGESPFVSCGDIENDRYMWLAGLASKILKGEMEPVMEMPARE